MIKGQCLCGKIQYEYRAELTEVAVCHCYQCKLAQGVPFATNAPIESKHFSFLQGATYLKSYYSSPNKRRCFCGECGSPIFSQRMDKPSILRIRLGTVIEGKIPSVNHSQHLESRSTWYTDEESKCQPNASLVSLP